MRGWDERMGSEDGMRGWDQRMGGVMWRPDVEAGCGGAWGAEVDPDLGRRGSLGDPTFG